MTQELTGSFAGSHISTVIDTAINQANTNACDVGFTFNDTRVVVHPGG